MEAHPIFKDSGADNADYGIPQGCRLRSKEGEDCGQEPEEPRPSEPQETKEDRASEPQETKIIDEARKKAAEDKAEAKRDDKDKVVREIARIEAVVTKVIGDAQSKKIKRPPKVQT